MSLFVTGTDTGVGKTVVAALLLARHGPGRGYWKPVATGRRDGRDVTAVRRWLGTAADVRDESYLYDPPVSPHLAAARVRRPIHADVLRRRFLALERERPGRWVVEGAGGVLVPLTPRGWTMADLIRTLRLPAIVVARSTLGTINHTLLTVEALRRRRIDVAGVVLNGPPNRENRRAIERYGAVEVLGEVARLRSVNAMSIRRAARRLDPDSHLLSLLQ